MTSENHHTTPRLHHDEWLRAEKTQAVFAALAARGHITRCVGGAVRNAVIGEPISDIDLATDALPDQAIEAAEAADLKVFATGLQHGTITVVSGGIPHEVTTLRADVETDGRHASVAFTDDWEVDARRRDFTMNALYCDADGTIFDPLGGYDDLRARRVRFIDDAGQRIREDYLRILRFFRFNAQYGHQCRVHQCLRHQCREHESRARLTLLDSVHAEGLHACIVERGGLTQLSSERIRVEMLKLLAAPRGIEICQIMFETGFLTAILGTVPQMTRLKALVAIEQTMEFPPDPVLRLAALGVTVREQVSRLARRLRLSNAERGILNSSARLNDPTAKALVPRFHPNLTEVAARRALYRLGHEEYTRRVILSWARSLPRLLIDADMGSAASPSPSTLLADADAWKSLLALPDRWPIPVMPVGGADVMALGVAAGPDIGDLLRAFEDWWIKQAFTADKAAIRAKLAGLVAAKLRT